MEFSHIPVMPDECISNLRIDPDGIYVDGTCGGGNHSFMIAQHLEKGKLICIDQDTAAIEATQRRLSEYTDKLVTVHNNFKNIRTILSELGISGIDGALLDLGVSSHQIDTPGRGFSYMHDAPLDMRMDKRAGMSAYDVVNGYSAAELERVLFEYGEERWAKRIVQFILREREHKPVETTHELVRIIEAAIPKAARESGGHPAKRTFQGIRCEVNGELSILTAAIEDFADILNPGGRLCIITFHSLEYKIVKGVFVKESTGCTCPRDLPICVCGGTARAKMVSKKPIVASQSEAELNTRSKSAKLLVLEKL